MKPYYQSSTVTAYNCRFQEVIKDLPSDLLVVSDPPYNIGFKYDLYKDTMPDDEYIEMLAEFQKFGRVVLCHYPVETMRWIVTINKNFTNLSGFTSVATNTLSAARSWAPFLNTGNRACLCL